VATSNPSRSPRWYGIPVRVFLATLIGTLVCFAVSLMVGILGTIAVSAMRGVHPDMRIAYRLIALPIGAVAGAIIFVLSVIMEVRHYQQTKTLAALEKMN
jgi:hypothetical protein